MMENDTISMSSVLYQCGIGATGEEDMRLVPLLLCYLATGSRELSYGNVDVLSEIDATAYCPQCLDYRDAMSSLTKCMGLCSNADGGCRACPHCQSPLSVKIDEATDSSTQKYYHHCGYCRYQSPIHLVLSKYDKTTNVTKELNQKIIDQYEQISINDTFRKLCDDYNKNSDDTDMTPLATVSEEETQTDWIMNKTLYTSNSTIVLTSSAKYYQKDSNSDEDPSLLPYPIPLHTRKIRRCRKELAAGRTGILMKPKPNPLEGDSSLRSGHGQWWKKDSSAIHMVPKVDLWDHSLHKNEEKAMLSFVLKIQNPTLTSVSLQLGCRNGHNATVSRKIQNVIVDPVHFTRVNSSILQYPSDSNGDFVWTDVISLEAMEDAALREWKNSTSTKSNDADNSESSTAISQESKVKLLSCNQDEAFAEFNCPIDIPTATKNDDAEIAPTHFALPLQMRILIQPGSWELPSYRASTKETSTKEQEYVNFNLYVVCPF